MTDDAHWFSGFRDGGTVRCEQTTYAAAFDWAQGKGESRMEAMLDLERHLARSIYLANESLRQMRAGMKAVGDDIRQDLEARACPSGSSPFRVFRGK